MQWSTSCILFICLERFVILVSNIYIKIIWPCTLFLAWEYIADFEFHLQSGLRMWATLPQTGLNHRFIPLTIVLLLLIEDGLSCKSSSFLSDSDRQAILKECLGNGYTAIQCIQNAFGNHNHLFLRPIWFVPYSKVFTLLYMV